MPEFTEHQTLIMQRAIHILQTPRFGAKMEKLARQYLANIEDVLGNLETYEYMVYGLQLAAETFGYTDYSEHKADYCAMILLVVEDNLHIERGGVQ